MNLDRGSYYFIMMHFTTHLVPLHPENNMRICDFHQPYHETLSVHEKKEYYLQKSKKLFLRLTWKFQGGSSSVQWACWGQALRMNLKQPRASWETEDALTAPCCRLNFTALCFADLHFGLKISLVFFYFFGPTHENHFVRLPSAVLFLCHI